MSKYDYNEACPISMAASVVCERWTLQIVRELFFGSTRYSDIQKHIPNISPSLLRNRLRFLEEQGVILRKKSTSGNRYEQSSRRQLLRRNRTGCILYSKYSAWA